MSQMIDKQALYMYKRALHAALYMGVYDTHTAELELV